MLLENVIMLMLKVLDERLTAADEVYALEPWWCLKNINVVSEFSQLRGETSAVIFTTASKITSIMYFETM